MKTEIRNNLNQPELLEALFRKKPAQFKTDFIEIYPEISANLVAQCWHERLNHRTEKINWGSASDLTGIAILSLIAAFIVKLPDIFGIDEEFFFSRNAAFLFLPLLIFYFSRNQHTHVRKWIFPLIGTVISILYINLLPDNTNSSTLILACIHLPLLIWGLLGYVFNSENGDEESRRLQFLQYNGDLAVMLGILFISGFLLSAITIGLFGLIDLQIGEFYFRYIAICGAAAAPLIGTFLIQFNPQLVRSVSPVVARIFTPLVFVMLTIYLIAVFLSGKDPYNDREFLLFFNLLLVGVMALILFSVLETNDPKTGRFNFWIIFGLALVTILINGVALSAILFRIDAFGITPNRLAVFGSNLLMLLNLIRVTIQIFNTLKNNASPHPILKVITSYLPVYLIWCVLVVFLFPILFGFR